MNKEAEEAFNAAPEIDFSTFDPATRSPVRKEDGAGPSKEETAAILRTLRVIPASPSYFTAKPRFTDDFVHIGQLVRRYKTLPTVRPGDQPKTAWRDFDAYKSGIDEPIRQSRYQQMIGGLRRLNMIHPAVMPEEVQVTLNQWARPIQPSVNRAKPIEVDEFGRAAAVGKRKSSAAKAWVVEGEGEVLVNGKPLHQAFARVHDRQSAVWALKVTNRLDKYNVFAVCRGGGTTGQAEAMTLAVSKALMAHEPLLKTTLRKGACKRDNPPLHSISRPRFANDQI